MAKKNLDHPTPPGSINSSEQTTDLPEEWVVKYSKSRKGKIYYFNTITKQSTWEKPQPIPDVQESASLDATNKKPTKIRLQQEVQESGKPDSVPKKIVSSAPISVVSVKKNASTLPDESSNIKGNSQGSALGQEAKHEYSDIQRARVGQETSAKSMNNTPSKKILSEVTQTPLETSDSSQYLGLSDVHEMNSELWKMARLDNVLKHQSMRKINSGPYLEIGARKAKPSNKAPSPGTQNAEENLHSHSIPEQKTLQSTICRVRSSLSLQGESADNGFVLEVTDWPPYTDCWSSACISDWGATENAESVQEIEEMEVSEEGVLIQIERQSTSTEASTQAIPEGSSAAEESKPDTDKSKIILVIDTNVLISNLKFLRHILLYEFPGLGKPTLVLPWLVVQELDCLKNRSHGHSANQNIQKAPSTSFRAAEAVRFIYTQLVNQNPHLIGQTPQQATQAAQETHIDQTIEGDCNDDKILQCSLQFQCKYPKSLIVLITRDINLINKAMIMGIKAATNETLWTLLNLPRPQFATEREDGEPETGKRGKKRKFKETAAKKVNNSGVKTSQKPRAKKAKMLLKKTGTRTFPVLRSNGENEKTCSSHKQSDAEKAFVLNKIITVKKLIFDIRQKAALELAAGQTDSSFAKVVKIVRPLLSNLKELFVKCLSLSPLVLQENMNEFINLSECLNSFYVQAHITYSDPSRPVLPLQLLKLFEDPDNRITLSTVLEQLTSYLQDIDDLLNLPC